MGAKQKDAGKAQQEIEIRIPANSKSDQLSYIGALTSIVLGLYLTSFYSYLLFHSLIEITTVAVSFTLFILTLNTRKYWTNNYIKLLGVGYAFIALIDLLHTLAYKGMGLFPGYGANLPTQLWIAARYLQAFTLLAAPLCIARKVSTRTIIGIYAIAISVLVAMVYSGGFPDCYIEGKGLTAFKISSEYIITALLLVSLYLLYGKRKAFNKRVFLLLAASITCTAFSEIAFTTYVSVYGFANLVGHFAKLAAFYLLYRALVVTGLKEPFDVIFRDLKQTEEALRKSQDALEEKVRERTAELYTSEARYRSLVQKVQTAIVLHDGQGRVLDSNPLARELLGLSEEQILGKSLIDPGWHFLREDGSVMPVAEYPVSRLLRSRQPLRNYMVGIRRPDRDDIAWVLVNAEPEYDDAGQIVLVVVSFVDISERKAAEERINVSEERLRLTLEATQIGIWDWDVVNDRYYASPIYYTMLGYDPKEGLADRNEWVPRLHPDDKNLVLEQVNKVLSGASDEYSYEARFLHADGSYRWQWALGYGAEHDKDEKVTRMLGLRLDIDKRKRMEDELTEYRGHLEELVRERTAELEEARNKAQQYLDIAGVILVALNADRRVTLINQKGCEILESTSEEIVGKDWFETFVPESARQDVIQGFRQLMAGELEPVEYFENPVLTSSGKERLVAWHNVLLRDGDGNITGTLSSGEDITEQKHAEEQITSLNQDLRNRAAALEAANIELDAFAYSVSHDLRAPLRHIDGFVELLQKKTETALDEQSQHYMDTISSSAKRMGAMIDDLLSFSRMSRHQFSYRRVDLGQLAREIILEFEPDTKNRNIQWRVSGLPVVIGDHAMLHLVLVNLISNALKFTQPRPQADIEIGCLPDTEAETIIFVRDNGVGFDMKYVDRIFKVFRRLHPTEEFEGTGIGLANVRRIINRHGGRTWAKGELDQGATFYFSLPRSQEGV